LESSKLFKKSWLAENKNLSKGPRGSNVKKNILLPSKKLFTAWLFSFKKVSDTKQYIIIAATGKFDELQTVMSCDL
jgi:hypothetical protein